MPATSTASGTDRNDTAGWLAGFLVILAVLAVGAVLWFTHHP